jgi:hypothetical protein
VTPESYLRTKGWKVRKAPGEWQTQCPFCKDTNKYGHLYVNREHGAFFCQRCGEKGSFFGLQVKLGDTPERATQEAAEKQAVWRSAVDFFKAALQEQPEALRYLKKERGLKSETIGKYHLGWAPRDAIDLLMKEGYQASDLRRAGFFTEENRPVFWDRIMVPYFQQSRVVAMRGKSVGGNMLQAKDSSIQLFGVDNIRGHKEVFICEGEFDAMYLDQLGYPACAIPGALNYQEHWNWWFEEARRVFVVLDADEAGRKGAMRIQSMLGRKARVIEFPVPTGEKSTDVTEFFLRDGFETGDFDALVDKARGQRLYSVGEALLERDDLRSQQGLLTGWKELDMAIHPGLLPGQLVTILAKTGAGKTALITQLAHNLSSWQTHGGQFTGPSIPTLILSLEQTKAEIGERLQRIGRLYNPWASRKEFIKWYSKVQLCDENKIPAVDVPLLVEEFIEEVGVAPRLMVVDYLGYWSRAFKGKSKYEQVSEAVMELKRIAKEHDLAIIAPHQVSRMGKRGQRLELDFARDSGVVEETSDFVFSLYRPSESRDIDHPETTWKDMSEVKLEILKSRHGAVGRILTFMWAPYSLSLAERDGDLVVARRVEKEWELLNINMLYENVLKVHKGDLFM